MSNEYKRLNEELDSADLDSIMPGFDREASWKELQPRLKKTNNRVYVWRYAAALVVILFSAVLVRMQMNKQSTGEQVATTVPASITPATIDTNIAPAQQQVETPVASHVAATTRKKVPRKANTMHEVIKPEPQTPHIEEQIAATEQELKQPEAIETIEQTVVIAKPIVKRPKAVHLLDIDNENRQAVIQNRRELQGGLPQRIVNLIPGRQYSNTDDSRKPASLFKVN